jgi:hypothetical protein
MMANSFGRTGESMALGQPARVIVASPGNIYRLGRKISDKLLLCQLEAAGEEYLARDKIGKLERWLKNCAGNLGSAAKWIPRGPKKDIGLTTEKLCLFHSSLIDRRDKFFSNKADEAGVGHFYFKPVPPVFHNV